MLKSLNRPRRTSRKHFLELVLFAAVGFINTAIDFAAYLALTRIWLVDPLTANVVGYLLGSLHSYIANGKVTFRGSGSRLLSVRPAILFIVTLLTCLGVSTLVVYVFLAIVPDIVAKALATLATFAVGFWMSRAFVFVQESNGRP